MCSHAPGEETQIHRSDEVQLISNHCYFGIEYHNRKLYYTILLGTELMKLYGWQ